MTPLDLQVARKQVLSLGHLKLWVYWTDFLFSYAVGVLGLGVASVSEVASWTFWIAATVSVLALYRALAFIHELAHFRSRLARFRVVWNALCGVPMAFPSFMYTRSHAIHHNPKTYGTHQDGEYVAFQVLPIWHSLLYLASSFWTAPLLVLRFAVLFPISLFSPRLRRFLEQKGSSVVITFDHVGAWPTGSEKTEADVMERAICLFWWAMAVGLWMGWVSPRLLVVGYAVLSVALFLNNVRTLAAHRFANDGRVLTVEEQLLDSVNLTTGFPGSMLSALVAPVGLRFHALHHLFPFLPYHALGAAHRRLVGSLPSDSVYHLTSERGAWRACLKLWKRQSRASIPALGASEPA